VYSQHIRLEKTDIAAGKRGSNAQLRTEFPKRAL
jgi:hypothetical protein